jgi:drug/metabolite transporter (DMT)-like permease
MSPTLIATIAGLITAICWGTGDWMAAKSSKTLKPIDVNWAFSATGLLMAGVLMVVTDVQMPTIGQTMAIIASSTLITTAFILFVKALTAGPVGIIVPLGNSYPLITILLSIVFLNEIFNGRELSAMVGIVLGASVLAYEKNHKKIPLIELHKDTILAAAAAVVWGIAFFILGFVVDEIPWQTIVVTAYLYSFIMGSVLLAISRRGQIKRMMKKILTFRLVVVASIIGNFGGIALYVGSDYAGSIVIPAVLSGLGPLVASILGAVIDKEKLGTLKRVAAMLIVGCVIILNLQ